MLETPDAEERQWDHSFRAWIEAAENEGLDPNDVGEREWGDPSYQIETYYAPHIRPDTVVLELGPGTGRITRHVIGRCREMILVDFSQFVCTWLERYLAGKGTFRTICIDKPLLSGVPDGKINFLFACGVIEHIGLDDLRWFLEEFHRVLTPGGVAIFNFDNLMTEEGLAWQDKWKEEPGHRNIFRFYHPEMVSWLARHNGFEVLAMRTDQSRHAEIELRKALPAS